MQNKSLDLLRKNAEFPYAGRSSQINSLQFDFVVLQYWARIDYRPPGNPVVTLEDH